MREFFLMMIALVLCTISSNLAEIVKLLAERI